MRARLLTAFALATLSCIAVTACTASSEEETDDAEGQVGIRNLTANNFGLADKEVVLTLDDGPGPRTVEVAEFLAREKVPAVFFMVGKNAEANPNTVKRVAELSAASGGTLIIANHSQSHGARPLPQQGTDATIGEIMNADRVLAPNIAKSQQGLPSAVSFFRPPYGAFGALGQANVARINAAGAEKYTGPVFWDIGGELKNGYSADWACWGRNGVSVPVCADGYIKETRARGKGIILVHDVHSKTIDMLMGTGSANGRSLIKDLKAQGYKFVSLRAHEEAIVRYQADQQRLGANTQVTINAQVTSNEDGRVVVDVKTQNAVKVVAQFDNDGTRTEFSGDKQLTATLAPGSHFLTVTGYNAAGAAVSEQRYSIVVAAPIEQGSEESTNEGGAVCVNFNLMKAGQAFRIYHGKVACGTAGAINPPFIDECYKYKGVLRASRDPRLVGAGEWSLDFDLSYAADPNDKSKITAVVDADDGALHTGKRYARGANRPDVPITFDSADCAHGEWRGKFNYSNGSTEDVLFRAVRSPQTGGGIDYRE
jgi:peptidoglycan/xylan/chitin deacetylase (PgdA/CDA1 family)